MVSFIRDTKAFFRRSWYNVVYYVHYGDALIVDYIGEPICSAWKWRLNPLPQNKMICDVCSSFRQWKYFPQFYYSSCFLIGAALVPSFRFICKKIKM